MEVRYTRLFADASGASHFEDRELGLEPGFAVPPAEPLSSAPLLPAETTFFFGGPASWKGTTAHPAPRRMLLVTIRGEYRITASDGQARSFPLGSVLLMENTTGAGHSTRFTHVDGAIVLAVGLPEPKR